MKTMGDVYNWRTWREKRDRLLDAGIVLVWGEREIVVV
jgi:hypothetical protein